MKALPIIAAAVTLALTVPAGAQDAPRPDAAALTYADLVGLAEAAPLVVRAEIRDQAVLEPERSPGLAPGHVRLYIEARTKALIAGNVPLGEELRYLVDVPLTAKGKAPKLKKTEVLLFARTVPGRPGELQLVGEGAQQIYSADLESRLRPVLTSLVAPDAPSRRSSLAICMSAAATT